MFVTGRTCWFPNRHAPPYVSSTLTRHTAPSLEKLSKSVSTTFPTLNIITWATINFSLLRVIPVIAVYVVRISEVSVTSFFPLELAFAINCLCLNIGGKHPLLRPLVNLNGIFSSSQSVWSLHRVPTFFESYYKYKLRCCTCFSVSFFSWDVHKNILTRKHNISLT
jgi:hypothetical protein